MSNEWTDGTAPDWWDENNPWNDHPFVRTGGELTRGEKAADTVRNRMGSWGFVITFCAFMCVWAITNTFVLGNSAYDPYPYILLNLFLSMLAGLQGAILLIAAKRADAVSAEQAMSHLQISKESAEILHRLETELSEVKKLSHELRTFTGDAQ